jgi:hypothetical protein
MINHNDSDIISDILILIPLICKLCSIVKFIKLTPNKKSMIYAIISILTTILYVDISNIVIIYYSKDIFKLLKLCINISTIINMCVKLYK